MDSREGSMFSGSSLHLRWVKESQLNELTKFEESQLSELTKFEESQLSELTKLKNHSRMN